MSESMIERVSRAICAGEYEDPNEMTNAYPDGPMYPVWKDFEWCARAAIKAMREPTEEMMDLAEKHIPSGRFIEIRWKRMIDAALDDKASDR